jgi:hypothetical protein
VEVIHHHAGGHVKTNVLHFLLVGVGWIDRCFMEAEYDERSLSDAQVRPYSRYERSPLYAEGNRGRPAQRKHADRR